MNVYAQLGFPDAEEMLVKAQLVSEAGEILRKRKWSQQQAAKVGVDHYRQLLAQLEELSQINAELLRRGEALADE